MSVQHLEFNQRRLRKDGVRLARLAAFGEIMLVVALVAIPLILFRIQQGLATSEQFLPFLRSAYLTGPISQSNLYGVVKALVAILVLDRTRRLGFALSRTEPLGPQVATHVRGLMWAMAVAVLAMCFSVELTHHPLDTIQTEWSWSSTWRWSAAPVFLGAIVLLGLSIVERIIRHANLLDAEVQEFV